MAAYYYCLLYDIKTDMSVINVSCKPIILLDENHFTFNSVSITTLLISYSNSCYMLIIVNAQVKIIPKCFPFPDIMIDKQLHCFGNWHAHIMF